MVDKSDIDEFKDYIDEHKYKSLEKEEKMVIQKKVDNFFESIYLAPQLMDPEVIKYLVNREKKLSDIRKEFSYLGGITFFLPMLIYQRRGLFKLKTLFWTTSGSIIFSYIFGTLAEYYCNNKYYKFPIMNVALRYNISDSEILELHTKLNEWALNQNKLQEHKKFSLDKVKIKF